MVSESDLPPFYYLFPRPSVSSLRPQFFQIPSPSCLIIYCFPPGSHLVAWFLGWLWLQCYMSQMQQEPGSTFDCNPRDSHEWMLLHYFKEMLFPYWWCGCVKAESIDVPRPSTSQRNWECQVHILVFLRATTKQLIQDSWIEYKRE